MVWRIDDPQGDEASKVKYDIVKYTRGAVLDLGCGPHKAFPHFIGIDNMVDTGLFGIEMKPDIVVADCADLSDTIIDGSCDAIFSSHLLEHIDNTEAALRDWWRCIKIGGYLVLYLPHRDLYPNIGTPGANPDHKHDFIPLEIIEIVQGISEGFNIVRDEVRNEGMEYSFLLVLQKTEDGLYLHSAAYDCHPEKACVVRYGGFGDMLQAANLLPQLKREGYHVTVMTTPKGQDILMNDPHIDDWFIQDNDQVPNHELNAFWAVQATHFDKFIQLSESVEGTLLALPGRANHMWPDAVRRVELNRNYLEWTAALAELDYHSDARFYPTDIEKARVQRYLGNVRSGLFILPVGVIGPPVFSILWALSGSSIHKFYPWQDSVIAQIMLDMPDAVVIFNGDEACKILEAGWEEEPRVRCESGNMSIRDSLALAQQVDCVVGPETGLLNGVAFESHAKVVLLSHSTKENLTKHWTNTVALEPEETPCYPCHRMHYTRDFCHEHEPTGAAMCQINITPDRVYDAIHAAYVKWKLK